MTESVIPLKEFDQEMASTRKLLERSPEREGHVEAPSEVVRAGASRAASRVDSRVDCDVPARVSHRSGAVGRLQLRSDRGAATAFRHERARGPRSSWDSNGPRLGCAVVAKAWGAGAIYGTT